MCSVVGYIGKNYCKDFILRGLKKLEYRGYDSAGFACLDPENKRLLYLKSEGKLHRLIEQLANSPIDGFLGIGHTRWSTHGVASQVNAHPHFDCQKNISVVHNGIVENHHELRRLLTQAGHVFHSSTDTEIIAHLLEALLISHKTVKASVIELVNRLEGAFAFIIIMQDHPDTMLLVRKRSPLCIGIGDGETFVASDLLAFAAKTKKVLFMPDESFALVRNDMIELYDFTGKVLPMTIQEVDVKGDVDSKKGHDHFMLKEIYEQKGYDKEWIDKRLRGIAIRQNLTDEWKERGITASLDYAILTAEISKATFGMTPSEYKKHKNIPVRSKANLRDNMTDLELIFTMLGERVTTEISQNEDP